MALSVRQPVGPDEVREIVGLTNDVYRNHWITYAYSDISRRLHEHIGDNASWCTFSTWSSRLIGVVRPCESGHPGRGHNRGTMLDLFEPSSEMIANYGLFVRPGVGAALLKLLPVG